MITHGGNSATKPLLQQPHTVGQPRSPHRFGARGPKQRLSRCSLRSPCLVGNQPGKALRRARSPYDHALQGEGPQQHRPHTSEELPTLRAPQGCLSPMLRCFACVFYLCKLPQQSPLHPSEQRFKMYLLKQALLFGLTSVRQFSC